MSLEPARDEGRAPPEGGTTDAIVWQLLALPGPCPICCSTNDCAHRKARMRAAFNHAEGAIECRECGEYWNLRSEHVCGYGDAHPLFDPPKRRGRR